ncbi:MAG: hypothetical protein A6F71_10510 [Cycloclasticus sp. symbiont of Poecilosclerida sp. M]|nr:MAG: hypothetical protein A6F71_10510 [Cycloclasticus sp. symbiont of Poecilosclerida sp. M]
MLQVHQASHQARICGRAAGERRGIAGPFLAEKIPIKQAGQLQQSMLGIENAGQFAAEKVGCFNGGLFGFHSL